MVRFSQILVSIINVLALLWSIHFFIDFSSAINRGHVECSTNRAVRDLIYGVLLFSLSVVGLIGAIRGNRRLLLVYAGSMFVWFACLLLLSASLLMVSEVSDPKATKDHGEYQAYQLNEYPEWLRRWNVDGEKWVPLKRCMVKECKGPLLEKETFGVTNPSPNLHGCCQPPLHCGFVHKNDTYWEVPKSGFPSEDPDCQTWKSNLDQLCYDCNSCKAEYIRSMKLGWMGRALMYALCSCFIFLGFWIAFWAFRQASREDHHRYTSNNLSAA